MNFVDARPASMAPLPALKLEPPSPPLVASSSSSQLAIGDHRAGVVACVRRSISLAPARHLMLPSSPVSSCSGSASASGSGSGSATPPKDKLPSAGRQRWVSSSSWAVGASASSGDSLEGPPSYSSARRLPPTASAAAVASTPWGHDASESRQLSLRASALAHSVSDGPQSMSRSTLPRCAVVNFHRDGDVVRWTPRARENTGGMAARVRNFDDAFQLEELSSRNFGFSNPRILPRDHMDISGVLAAAAEAGMGAPPPPPSRRHRLARALRMWRPASAVPKSTSASGKPVAVSAVPTQSAPAAIQAKPSLRRSVSASDLGCVPAHARRRAEGHAVTPKPRKQRWFTRIASSRRGKRNDMALFDADALLIKHQAPQRATKPLRRVRSGWWQKADAKATPVSKAADNHGHRVRRSMRGAVDHYIEFMDDF